MRGPDAQAETLEIPPKIRAIVDERDGFCCRVCGRYLGPARRAHHHVRFGGDFQGMGGRRIHDPNTLITVCWLPGDGDCHALVHSNKALWTPILLHVAQRSSVTALQVQRWLRSAKARAEAPTSDVAAASLSDLES